MKDFKKLKIKLNLVIIFAIVVVSLATIAVLIYYPLGGYLGLRAATLTVCAGNGCDYTSIESAVDAAADGDTISISNGTYNEAGGADATIISITDKSLTITGESRAGVIINSTNTTAAKLINIQNSAADSTTLSNFTISGVNSGDDQVIGINDVDSVTLSNIKITNTPAGLASLKWVSGTDGTIDDMFVYSSSATASSGIMIREGSNVDITDTIVANLASSYQIWSGSGESANVTATCNHCVSYGAAFGGGGAGFASIVQGTGNATFTVNNSIAMGADRGAYVYDDGDGTPTLTSNYNLYYSNTANYADASAGANDYCSKTSDSGCQLSNFDPVFADVSSGDFSITNAASEAINGGDGTYLGALGINASYVSAIDVGGGSNHFSDIANAIAAVSTNSARTINVYAGSYTNQAFTMKKDITLSGAGANTTTLTGDGSNPVITDGGATGYTISGFAITGGTHGISATGTGTISNNIITANNATGTTTWEAGVSPFKFGATTGGATNYNEDFQGNCATDAVLYYEYDADVFTSICTGNTTVPDSDQLAAATDGFYDMSTFIIDAGGGDQYCTIFFHASAFANLASWNAGLAGMGSAQAYVHNVLAKSGSTWTYNGIIDGVNGVTVETDGSGSSVFAGSTEPSLTSVTIYDAGVYVNGGTITLSGNTISSNGDGLQVVGAVTVTSANDTFSGNTGSDYNYSGLTGAGSLAVTKTITATITKDSDSSNVESVSIAYDDNDSSSGNFNASTGANGQASQSLTFTATASGVNSYTLTATGANSRSNTDTVTISDSTSAITFDYTVPSSTSISIAASDSSTTKTTAEEVTLTLAATDATQMMISNNSDFSGASWEDYTTSKSWTLSEEAGTRTVYVKFRDAYTNTSSAVSDNIELVYPSHKIDRGRSAASTNPEAPSDSSSDSSDTTVVEESEGADGTEEAEGTEATDEEVKEIIEESQMEEPKEVHQEVAPKVTEVISESGEVRLVVAEPDAVESPEEILPEERILMDEQTAIGLFGEVHGYLPSSDRDWIFVSWVAYDLRPGERDSDKENQAIAKFKIKYGANPATDADWSLVRAMAYVE